VETEPLKTAENETEFAIRDLQPSEALAVLTEVAGRVLARYGLTPNTPGFQSYLELHTRILPARVRRLHREAREVAN
jgi:hypothetical protein